MLDEYLNEYTLSLENHAARLYELSHQVYHPLIFAYKNKTGAAF